MLLSESTALTWPVIPDVKPQTTPPATDAQWTQAKASAVEWLWQQTGRRIGTRTVAYRPQGLVCTGGGYDYLPYLQSICGPLWGEGWPYLTDPRYGSKVIPFILELPGPAVQPTSDTPIIVTLTDGDGNTTVLSTADMTPVFRLDGNFLIRYDGTPWPSTQNLIGNPGDPNTWTVAYIRGTAPSPQGQQAAQMLSCEWLKWILNSKDCKLPWNATSASRSGVAVQLNIAMAFRTSGIALVDRFVQGANPNGLVEPPKIWSPDLRRNGPPYAGSSIPYRTPGI